MSGPDWYRWFPAKWASGVILLTPEQRGVYIDIINVIYDRGECPEDFGYLAKVCNCRVPRVRRIVGELVAHGKLSIVSGTIRQQRAHTERTNSEEFSELQRQRGRHRHKNKHLAVAADGLAITTTTTVRESENIRDSVASTETPAASSEEATAVALLGQKAGSDLAEQPDLDALFYKRGKALLGQKAGGQLTKLRNAVGSVGVALEIIDKAQHKDSPAEYVAGCIRNRGNGYARSTGNQRASVVEAVQWLDERREEDHARTRGDEAAREVRKPD